MANHEINSFVFLQNLERVNDWRLNMGVDGSVPVQGRNEGGVIPA